MVVHHNARFNVTLNSATGSVGSVTMFGKANVFPIGQSAIGSVGTLLVWSRIDESQTPNYNNITDTQTPNWEEVA